jgi:hypothetical protein
MFTIFRRPSKIYVDCFTDVEELPKFFPIQHASERMPPFWKNIPTTINFEGVPRGTMKTCPGVSSLYRTGFIIQAWHDMWLSTENNQLTWQPEPTGESHNPLQWNNSSFQNHHHLKMVSPWRIKEKTGVKFLFTNTLWHNEDFKPKVMNGIVDYKYQHTSSVNMFVPKNMFPKTQMITAGTELAQVIPLSDKDVVIKMHVVSSEELKKLQSWIWTFNGHFFKRKKLLQERGE